MRPLEPFEKVLLAGTIGLGLWYWTSRQPLTEEEAKTAVIKLYASGRYTADEQEKAWVLAYLPLSLKAEKEGQNWKVYTINKGRRTDLVLIEGFTGALLQESPNLVAARLKAEKESKPLDEAAAKAEFIRLAGYYWGTDYQVKLGKQTFQVTKVDSGWKVVSSEDPAVWVILGGTVGKPSLVQESAKLVEAMAAYWKAVEEQRKATGLIGMRLATPTVPPTFTRTNQNTPIVDVASPGADVRAEADVRRNKMGFAAAIAAPFVFTYLAPKNYRPVIAIGFLGVYGYGYYWLKSNFGLTRT